MIDDFGDLGADWTAEWRHLRVRMAGWIHANEITFRLGLVHKAALAADKVETKANLQLLEQAVMRLEHEVDQQAHRLTELRQDVGDFSAAVHQARTLAAGKPDPKSEDDLEAERIAQLVAQSEIGLDRVGRLFGLDRHTQP